jgi:hypothetical protein
MGDDAEYYIEQQEIERRLAEAFKNAELDRNRKSLLTWAGGLEDEVWSWEPLERIDGVFADLYERCQIGSDFFLAISVPIGDEGEDWNAESRPSSKSADRSKVKSVDGLEFLVTASATDATHEVIILSRNDGPFLRAEASKQRRSAKALRDKMLSEMIEAMASFIESESQQSVFVFAREL